MADRNMGIPDLKTRVDDSESARQWNKIREGVISLHNTPDLFERSAAVPQINGFSPIALRYYENPKSLEEYTPGVGLSAGRLCFLETGTITEVASSRNQSVEAVPTLGGTALDATVKPREELSDGDWEAWVVFKELGTTHEARISFATLDAGPGTLDRDEKAVRLATFMVLNNTSNTKAPPLVHVYDHIIRDELAIWTERHQFKARKTDDNKVKIDSGWVIFPAGMSDPLVAGTGSSITQEVAESAEFTITEAGSIWLKGTWTTSTLSSSSGGGTALTMYRLYEVDSLAFEFRATANPPTPGDDTSSTAHPWTTGDVYWEICKLSFADGETFVTDQLISGPIYLTEFTDGWVTGTS